METFGVRNILQDYIHVLFPTISSMSIESLMYIQWYIAVSTFCFQIISNFVSSHMESKALLSKSERKGKFPNYELITKLL